MLPILSASALVASGRRAGEGIHRRGTLVGNVCIKEALGYGGNDANQYEVEGWAALQGTSDADLFCEVLAHADDYSWVAMPLCQPLGWENRTEAREAGQNMDDIVDYSGWVAHVDFINWLKGPQGRRASALTSDLHMFNVMRHPDGRIVVTDYGMGIDGEPGTSDTADPDVWEDEGGVGCDCSQCAPRPQSGGGCGWGPFEAECPSCGWIVAGGHDHMLCCRCSICQIHLFERQVNPWL